VCEVVKGYVRWTAGFRVGDVVPQGSYHVGVGPKCDIMLAGWELFQ